MGKNTPERFVGLHAHSGLSIGDALGLPQEHMEYAFHNGMDALCLTDHGNINGLAHQQKKAKEFNKQGIKFKAVPGVEAYYVDDLKTWKELYVASKGVATVTRKQFQLQTDTVDITDIGNELKSTELELSDLNGSGTVVEDEEESKSNKPWLDPLKQRNHLVLLPKSSKGLQNLFRIVSASYLDGFYRYPRVDLNMLRDLGQGELIASSACLAGTITRVVSGFLPQVDVDVRNLGPGTPHDFDAVQRALKTHVERFIEALGKENYYLELQWNKLPIQHLVNLHILALAKQMGGVGVVSTADSHYSNPLHWREREIYKAMAWASKTKGEVDKSTIPELIDGLKCELYPKNAEQMWAAYKRYTEPYRSFYEPWDQAVCDSVELTHDIVHRQIGTIKVDDTVKLPALHRLVNKPGATVQQLIDSKGGNEDSAAFRGLVEVSMEALRSKGKGNDDEYIKRLKRELSDIKYLQENHPQFKLAKYFLTYKKIIELTSSSLFVGCGRGSVAGSLLAYVLGISQVDPLRWGTLWERFISRFKLSNPDIDNDWSNRNKAVELIRDWFGHDNVVAVSNFSQLQLRSLIKDLARFHSLDFQTINGMTSRIENEVLAVKKQTPGFDRQTWVLTLEDAQEHSSSFRKLVAEQPELAGSLRVLFKQLRNISRHAGGVVITEDARSAMPLIAVGGEPQTPWAEGLNYRHLEDLGLIKFDVLGLGTLRMFEGCVSKILKKHCGVAKPTFQQIRQWFDEHLHPDNNPMTDPKVYETVFLGGRFAGIFQFINQKTQKFIGDLSPSSVSDIAAATSIFRPGPLGLGIDKQFLGNKNNPHRIVYKHPLLKEILDPTCGCLIFQEQLQLIYHKLAGVPLEETDSVRKAFTKKEIANKDKAKADRDKLRKEFIDKCFLANNIEPSVSGSIFDDLENLVSYAFNKCIGENETVETKDRGLQPIKNIVPGEYVNSTNGFVRVKNTHYNGSKPLIKLTTKGGRTIVCTMDHKLQTPVGMKPVREILDRKLDIVCKTKFDLTNVL